MLHRLCNVRVTGPKMYFMPQRGTTLSKKIFIDGAYHYIVSGETELIEEAFLTVESDRGLCVDPDTEDIACAPFTQEDVGLFEAVNHFTKKTNNTQGISHTLTRYMRNALGCGVDGSTVIKWVNYCKELTDVAITYQDMVRAYCVEEGIHDAVRLFGMVDDIDPECEFTQMAVSFSNAVYAGVDVRKLGESLVWTKPNSVNNNIICEALHVLQADHTIDTKPLQNELAEDYAYRLVELASRVEPASVAKLFGIILED